MVRKILSVHYGKKDVEIIKSEAGKPFLKSPPPFFSVAHTQALLFVVVSDANVGIDAELSSRKTDYALVLSRFPFAERAEIRDKADFLRHWTAKESAVKWLGGTLAADLKKLSYLNGRMFFRELPLPVHISHFEKEGHIIALCREKDGDDPPFVRL